MAVPLVSTASLLCHTIKLCFVLGHNVRNYIFNPKLLRLSNSIIHTDS